jgi:hypothetical protein
MSNSKINSNEAKARAEASFKRKEQQAQDGFKAWVEYQAQRRAEAEKTQRLRALRLAKEAAEAHYEGGKAAQKQNTTARLQVIAQSRRNLPDPAA